ncbi:hypothetical protein DYU05_16375 [Mucilaginibacter terrenus]|uniref:Carboxypeptidase-like regulatory domain-containing protein n=1 Tax=Mucilaginibacter terrenus TaxID=2482727 RepID=A0A3E2NMG4_9SPHI|nr:hypothetical protein [Mucilaginibacter terrenus]RFZ82194.1 hypothetical protein DYU05_16375 [Mucilaginibacter terrenus]
MKYLLVLICLTVSTNIKSQTLTGRLIDQETRLPLKYIFVTSSLGGEFTDEGGNFTVKVRNFSDTVHINTMGYESFNLPAVLWGNFRRVIQLKPKPIGLNEVKIMAKRNYFKDSVSLRREFAKQFGYAGPKLTDVLRPTSSNVPFAFATVDLLSLFGALTKNKNAQSRLQKQLLKDEQARHIDRRFNQSMVTRITNLQGDSLENFLSGYRPSSALLDKLSDYDLILYVRKSAAEFRSGKRKNQENIFTKNN